MIRSISLRSRISTSTAEIGGAVVHFHKHSVKTLHIARQRQRRLAVVSVLRLRLLQQQSKERMIRIFCSDHKSLPLRSDVHRETAFRRHSPLPAKVPPLFLPVIVFSAGDYLQARPRFRLPGQESFDSGGGRRVSSPSADRLASLPGFQDQSLVLRFLSTKIHGSNERTN